MLREHPLLVQSIEENSPSTPGFVISKPTTGELGSPPTHLIGLVFVSKPVVHYQYHKHILETLAEQNDTSFSDCFNNNKPVQLGSSTGEYRLRRADRHDTKMNTKSPQRKLLQAPIHH